MTDLKSRWDHSRPEDTFLSLVLGDGAVDVGDYDLVVPAPQVDGALAATRPLVLGGDAEGDVIGPLP